MLLLANCLFKSASVVSIPDVAAHIVPFLWIATPFAPVDVSTSLPRVVWLTSIPIKKCCFGPICIDPFINIISESFVAYASLFSYLLYLRHLTKCFLSIFVVKIIFILIAEKGRESTGCPVFTRPISAFRLHRRIFQAFLWLLYEPDFLGTCCSCSHCGSCRCGRCCRSCCGCCCSCGGCSRSCGGCGRFCCS